MGVCNCSMFCCTLLYVHSSIAIILMGKRELIALLNLSSWCLVMVEQLFLAVPLGCLQFVIVVFPDHTHLLFLCVFSQLKDIKHIIGDFHSVAWVMPQGWDLGVPWGVGGSKNFFSQIQPDLVCELLT